MGNVHDVELLHRKRRIEVGAEVFDIGLAFEMGLGAVFRGKVEYPVRQVVEVSPGFQKKQQQPVSFHDPASRANDLRAGKRTFFPWQKDPVIFVATGAMIFAAAVPIPSQLEEAFPQFPTKRSRQQAFEDAFHCKRIEGLQEVLTDGYGAKISQNLVGAKKYRYFVTMPAKAEYRLFCKAREDLPLFAQDWYLDAVCEGGNWQVAMVKEGGNIVATLPYFLKKKGLFQYSAMPLHVKHLGPYLIPEKRILKLEHKLYDALIAQLPKLDYFLQDFHPSVTNWLPFFWEGFQQTTRYTYLLEDLTDLERVHSHFNRNIRRNIKKAEKQLHITSHFSLEAFYEINKMSFERQGIPIYFTFEQLQKQDEALAKHQARKLFFAIDDKYQIHAASYLIWDKQRSYYHLAGENPAFRGSGASILLTWKAVQFTAKELGLQVFDFEGSILQPIERIRRQFGGVQQAYFRVWKYNSSLFRLINLLKTTL